MIWAVIFLTIISLGTCKASITDLDDDALPLLWKLGNPSWESIMNTRMFPNVTSLNDRVRIVRQIDSYLEPHFRECFSNPTRSSEIQKYFDTMSGLTFRSHLLSANLIYALKVEVCQEGIQDAKKSANTACADYVTLDYLKENPLKMIQDVIYHRSNWTSTFMEQYQKFGNLCLNNISELQRTNILLEYFRWIFIKLDTISRLASQILLKANTYGLDMHVVNETLETLKIEKIIKDYNNTVNIFRGNLKFPSSAVFIQDSPIDTDGIHEIMLFKRTFLEECYARPRAPFHKNEITDTCSRMKNATGYCKYLSASKGCSEKLRCDKILCENLREETTVCLDQASDYAEYKYYFPSNQINARDCDEKGFYQLKNKTINTLGYAHTFCNPCQCTCQVENGTYYYSTELVTTNPEDNLVVIGAKLEIVSHTLVLRVKYGKLQPNGRINPHETSWSPARLGMREEISLIEMNAIDLTRVTVPNGHVLTGLSLGRGYGNVESSENRIQLWAYSHSYDFKEGLLNREGGTSTSGSGILEIEHSELVSPSEKISAQSSDSIVRDKFIRFTPSGGYDGGRTTLPLIDGRDVIPGILTPLSGAGLYFRKLPHGGAVGIELLTYNVVPLYVDQMPKTNKKNSTKGVH